MEVKTNNEIREALEACYDFIRRIDRPFNDYMQRLLEEAVKKSEIALAKPPRNCDIGSVIEQGERFTEFCDSHNCRGAWDSEKTKPICPFTTGWDGDCLIRWMQMPYEAKKGVQ